MIFYKMSRERFDYFLVGHPFTPIVVEWGEEVIDVPGICYWVCVVITPVSQDDTGRTLRTFYKCHEVVEFDEIIFRDLRDWNDHGERMILFYKKSREFHDPRSKYNFPLDRNNLDGTWSSTSYCSQSHSLKSWLRSSPKHSRMSPETHWTKRVFSSSLSQLSISSRVQPPDSLTNVLNTSTDSTGRGWGWVERTRFLLFSHVIFATFFPKCDTELQRFQGL